MADQAKENSRKRQMKSRMKKKLKSEVNRGGGGSKESAAVYKELARIRQVSQWTGLWQQPSA